LTESFCDLCTSPETSQDQRTQQKDGHLSQATSSHAEKSLELGIKSTSYLIYETKSIKEENKRFLGHSISLLPGQLHEFLASIVNRVSAFTMHLRHGLTIDKPMGLIASTGSLVKKY